MPVLPCLLALASCSGLAAGTGDEPQAPRLAILAGKVRVLAQEAWLTLPVGSKLPDSRANRLSLESGARARLTVDGASVEFRGPLEVASDSTHPWTVRISGAGKVELDVRTATVSVELESAARLELDAGVYWAEGVPGGGWRVGCEGGAPLVLRPPAGSGWSSAPRVVGGSSLRILPTSVVAPSLPAVIHRPEHAPWREFSWPWTDPARAR